MSERDQQSPAPSSTGEGFAFFRWHCVRYPGSIGDYCVSSPWAHRDYCLNMWEARRRG